MKKTIINILKIGIPLGIAVYLGWFFYGKMEGEGQIEPMKNALANANYFWVLLAIVIAWVSHFSRAYRWGFLMEPMGYKPKTSSMYHSLMVGYLINLTIPRSGEASRAVFLNRYEKVPFEKGFGTIVVERIIDVVMLLGVMFIATLLQGGNVDKFKKLTQGKDGESNLMLILIIIGCIGLAGFLAIMFIPKLKKIFVEKIKGLWEGVMTVFKMKKKWAFIGHTFLIWGIYVGMFWLCGKALPETSNLSLGAIFASFVAGAVAMTIFPGGVIGYPIMVGAVLTELYGIEKGGAFAFGSIMWLSQTIFMILWGLYSLFMVQRQEPVDSFVTSETTS